jgi:hypothetical protein
MLSLALDQLADLTTAPLKTQVPLERGLELSILSIDLDVSIVVVAAALSEQSSIDIEERTVGAALGVNERRDRDAHRLGVFADEGAADGRLDGGLLRFQWCLQVKRNCRGR